MTKPSSSPLNMGQKWFQWITNTTSSLFSSGREYGLYGYMAARYIGWIVVTTGIITLLPLVLEIKREAAVEELEALQISDAIGKGATPQDLANAGVQSAMDPKVLKG